MHTISMFVENHSGALSHIIGLFSSRGYNISSLTVAETEDPTVSRMTIVVSGESHIIEQVIKQLNRLIDVIKVRNFENLPVIDRELALVVVSTKKTNRHEIISLVNVYNGKVIEVSHTSIIFEICGSTSTLDKFFSLIRPYGIKELVRTGKIAIAQLGDNNN
ncbi:MAG: acetolactate synthase small subunit [Chitinispirillia bacterium]|jgi:acetolactate synthase-1/3 small subunit